MRRGCPLRRSGAHGAPVRSRAGGSRLPCTHRRPERFRAHLDERLRPGRSAAPGEVRLVLLPSGPDTVRDSPLRGTRSSTSLDAAALENGDLGWEFSPAIADCRFRAPLVPRLARHAKSIADRAIRASTESATSVANGRSPPRSKAELRDAIGPRFGGEGGIRTRDGLPRTAFPVRRHSPLGDLSAVSVFGTESRPAWRRPAVIRSLAERAGFEPAVLSHTAFRERHHQPLGHLSAREDTKGAWTDRIIEFAGEKPEAPPIGWRRWRRS